MSTLNFSGFEPSHGILPSLEKKVERKGEMERKNNHHSIVTVNGQHLSRSTYEVNPFWTL